MTFGKAISQLAVPAVILAGCFLLRPAVSDLPASLAGLKVFGGWGMLAVGATLALAFRRGRVVFALITLALAYASQMLFIHDTIDGTVERTVYAALCVLVPLNLAMLCLLSERGTFNIYGLQRLGVIAAEAIFTLWIVFALKSDIVGWAYQQFYDLAYLKVLPIPQLALAMMVLSFAAALVAGFVKGTPIDFGFAGAIAAFGIAAADIASPHAFSLFMASAALILTVAVLQDTFRMAFRDELTGLPSRRDLNERMMGLGRRYAIAMVDVDHFKKFNDTYGHDLGDQALKMVAMNLAEVGGGGTAYRYGGEEFTVLFPGKDLAHAMPYLETLRRKIEDYKLALRALDRPQKSGKTARQRGTFRRAESVSVTISIGVAERDGRLATPEDVIKAADKALYRAKNKGRNRVSR